MISRTALFGALALGLAGGLAACGKQVDLERPYTRGPNDAQMTQSQSSAAQARRDASASSDPDAPKSARELRVYKQPPVAPPRSVPIEGQGSDPFAAPVQGAIPDPYNHPERPGV